MFLSNVGGCGTSFTPLYSSAEQPIFTSDPFRNDTTSSHLSFYHYPPTFVQHDHDQLPVGGHLLPQQQLLTSNTNLVTEISIDCASMANIAEKQNPQQQKRLVKKDRHSKIKTAQGIRDRRMRLSLDVARDFFGLQDLRGDDKPSKTIRWLLNQCKGAIKEHSRAKNTSVSSTSECEVVSGIEENSNAGDLERGLMVITDQKQPCSLAKRGKRQPRKTKFHPFGKESREKARARARERTRDKIIRESQKIISSSPSETGEESGVSHGHHEMKSSMTEVEEPNFHLLHLQRPVMATTVEHTIVTVLWPMHILQQVTSRTEYQAQSF
ncbi:hypothetical protein NE237_021741 [Protea cynaroides]|uniref:CYCLOIDEA-like protein 2 n=1 Tax=Protea cynaroides TaxID=273540 RepID=A0A9Q0K3J9_9MAGN|nr:hypothetical protein NE237_021741 [Protea cynaroides]